VAADSGTVTLTVNGVLIAQVPYGDGSTPATIADSLASASTLAANSPVKVKADGGQIFITSLQTGAAADYPYQITVQDGAPGTTPSFAVQPAGGSLLGGASPSVTGTAQTVYQYKVGYDVAGNVVSMDDTANALPANPAASGAPVNSVMGAWSYGYDPFNRLISAASSSGPYVANRLPYICWSYDEFGNRTHQSLSNRAFVSSFPDPCQAAGGAALQDTSAAYTATFAPPPPAYAGGQYLGYTSGQYAPELFAFVTPSGNNRISSETLPGSSTPVVPAYDAAGDVVDDGVNTAYLYDAEGRICAVHGVYGMTGYQYDADGVRVGKGTITSMSCDPSVNGYTATNDYILDQSGDQMTETVPSGKGWMQWSHTNVWAAGALIATYDTAGLHFYLNDPLGTRRVQTDATGYIEQNCQSLPYGDALQCPLADPTEHHFTGKERDAESGLDYFGARYYASNMGRWMSPDWADKPEAVPYSDLENPQSLNLYNYVNNNPLSKADKDGHCLEDVCVVEGVAAVAVVALTASAYLSMPSTQRSLSAAGSQAISTVSSWFHKSDSKPAPADTKPQEPTSSAGGETAGEKFKPGERAEDAGKKCVYCGRQTTEEPGKDNSRETDHGQPRSRDGNREPENRNPSCRTCNRQKGNKTPEEFKKWQEKNPDKVPKAFLILPHWRDEERWLPVAA
jgi:RHS repeat-associated protein